MYDIPVTQVSVPYGSLRECIEQELSSKKASADVYGLKKDKRLLWQGTHLIARKLYILPICLQR